MGRSSVPNDRTAKGIEQLLYVLILLSLKFTFRQSYGWIFGVDSVQNSLISDLRLGDQGNFRAQIGHSTRWTHVWIRLGKDGKDIRRCSTASGAEMNEISDQMTDTNKLRDSEAWGSILRRYSEFHFFGRLKTSLKFSKAHLKSNIILISNIFFGAWHFIFYSNNYE